MSPNNHLPKTLYTSDQVRRLDKAAIEDHEIPGSTLMARAAEALFQVLTKQYPNQKNIAVFCGPGNNGGDGMVLARIAKPLHYNITVFLLADPEKLQGDANEAYHALQSTDVPILEYSGQSLKEFDVIVDALLGTGLERPVEDSFLQAIAAINESQKPVVAADTPSGLCANTGSILGAAVVANTTVSFVGMKQGLLTNDGPDHCGELLFTNLEIPETVYQSVNSSCERLVYHKLKDRLLPNRKHNTHKGDFGHALILGGNHGMGGAVILASQAALKTGCGLVSTGTQKEHITPILCRQPELMPFAVNSVEDIKEKPAHVTALAIGPGLGADQWAKELLESTLSSDMPLVIDADGLNLLSQKPQTRGNWILTPHPKEAARLLDVSVTNIQRDRFRATRELSKKYNAVVVLKGCGTLVCGDGQNVFLCDAGNPYMATAGMGDVLTGIITSLVAQKFTLLEAAQLGVCWHSTAGDLLHQKSSSFITSKGVLNTLPLC